MNPPTMTLRDNFAAKAMQGLLATAANPRSEGFGTNEFNALAINAYLMADTMLKVRGMYETRS